METVVNNRKQISFRRFSIILFAFFFCYLFVFQYIIESYVDEAIIILLLPILYVFENRKLSIKTYMMPIIVMFLLILIWSTEPHQSFLYYLIMVEAILFIKPDMEDIDVGLNIIKYNAFLNAIFVIVCRFFPTIMIRYARIVFSESAAIGYERVIGSNYYPGLNNQVAFTAVYLALGIISFTYDYRFRGYKKGFLLLFLWFALLTTNKRAILVYLFVAMLVVYYCNGKKGKRLNRAFQIVILVLLSVLLLQVAVFFFPNNSLVKRMMSLFSALFGDVDLNEALSGRVAIYKQVLSIFMDNKVKGIGWQNYVDYSRFRSLTGGANQGHNVFFQLLCETGIVGFTLFIAINVYYIRLVVRRTVSSLKHNNYVDNKESFYSNCSLAFMSIYYCIWFSGNALYDFVCVYAWIFSIMIALTINDTVHEE